MAGELHCQVAGESIRAFHNDRADAIAGDTVQHSHEARALRNDVCASHGLIVEPVNDDHAGRLGIALDCLSLARLAVLVGSDRQDDLAIRSASLTRRLFPAHYNRQSCSPPRPCSASAERDHDQSNP